MTPVSFVSLPLIHSVRSLCDHASNGQPEAPPESNPYMAAVVTDLPGDNTGSAVKRPSTRFVLLSVLGGMVIAIVTFCLTFFVTCAGMLSSGNGQNFSFEVLVAISTLVAFVAAVLFTWEIQKRIERNRK
jgi:cation transport ATPase